MIKPSFPVSDFSSKAGLTILSKEAFPWGPSLLRHLPKFMLYAGVCATLHPFLQAQIVATPGTPFSNRPIVRVAPNGTPVVQIAPPNAAGISENHFDQFDVESVGVIFSTSADIASVPQGPLFASSSQIDSHGASIILVRVKGAGASHFDGNIRIAGQPLEIIIANSAGIICNGGGFINTSRGVLTTGDPIIDINGSLNGFRVRGGKVEIGLKGFYELNVNELDLITRSLIVKGKLETPGNLTVVTGPNQVAYPGLSAQLLQEASQKPVVGIGLEMLGSMHANNISLTGTGVGAGLHSRGALIAQHGGFTCTQQGLVFLTANSKTTAGGDLTLNSKEVIINNGMLSAQGACIIASERIENSNGTIEGVTSLKVQSASNLINDGGLLRSNGALGANAKGDLVSRGGSIDGGMVTLHADQDLLIETTTRDIAVTSGVHTLISQIAKVSASEQLVGTSGRDILVNGGEIESRGDASLSAGRDATLSAVTTGFRPKPEPEP